MGLILLAFTYNPTRRASRRATNLISIGLYKLANDYSETLREIVPYWEFMIGSINIFQNMLKLNNIDLLACNGVTGNIEIACVNLGKLSYIGLSCATYNSTRNVYGHDIHKSTNVSGNIFVFGDKYDLQSIQILSYTNVYGQVKDMKNLKKIRICQLYGSNCTGSKTDLYNQGANVTHFRV